MCGLFVHFTTTMMKKVCILFVNYACDIINQTIQLDHYQLDVNKNKSLNIPSIGHDIYFVLIMGVS